jgi:mannose-6-phosphate isomerase-like protein (cupin superfamily)
MSEKLNGGVVFRADSVVRNEYLPNKGVFLGGTLTRARGDGFGLYLGRIEPGCGIAREIHPETAETVCVIRGQAIGIVGNQEVPLEPGDVLHVEKNVHHGLRNRGEGVLEFIVLGHPDF